MKAKKRSKLKSWSRFKFYNKFGWLGVIAYRLRGDGVTRKYLRTGKYIETKGDIYELFPGLEVQDLFISSTVKRSRVKNKPNGCVHVPVPQFIKVECHVS